MPARTLVTAGIIAALLSLTGCNDDQPDPVPKTSATPTPTVSPPPAAPDLASKEQKAYETAVDDFIDIRATLDSLTAEPRLTESTVDKIYKKTGNPLSKQIINDLNAMEKAGQHTEGHVEVAWSVATSVDLKAKEIVWLQCTTPGTFKFIDSDGKARSDTNTNEVRKITSERDDVGSWHATNIERAGTC